MRKMKALGLVKLELYRSVNRSAIKSKSAAHASARAILRFTSVDVSIAIGIAMFV